MDTRSVYLGIGLSILFSRRIPPLKWPIYKLNGNVTQTWKQTNQNSNHKKSVTNRNYILNNFINYPEHSDLFNLVLTFWTKVQFKSKSLSEFEPSVWNEYSCSVSDMKDTAFQLLVRTPLTISVIKRGDRIYFQQENKEPNSTVQSSNKCF